MAKPHHGRPSATIWERLQSRTTRYWAFLALFSLAALTGGGSRGDVWSLIVLRPLAVMFGGYALIVMPPGQLREFRALLTLVAACFVVAGWQLIPLPPSLWQELPFRDTIIELDRTLGFDGIWRPAALSPDGAINALFSLFVPASALLLYAALDPRDRPVLLPAICLFAVASALLGLMQLLGTSHGPLYLYAITNEGLPVGLFSNRNHHAILLACTMPILALWAATNTSRGRWVVPASLAGEALLLLVALLTGSRAGLIGTVIGLLSAGAVFLAIRQARAPAAGANPVRMDRRLIYVGLGVLGLVAIVSVLLMFDRGLALERLVATNPETETRLQAFPVVIEMLRDCWLLGVGPGSFPGAYQMFEPTSLLGPNYLNHAHNDWLEVPIEHGLPGVLVLLGVLVVLARYAMRLLQTRVRIPWGKRIAICAPPVILAIVSLVDYPLRTPSLAMIALLWLAAMADAPGRILAPPASKRR